jgi:hypothetical protein
MATHSLQIENHPAHGKGREARTQSIATRFTRADEQVLLKRAEASGKNLREWAREVKYCYAPRTRKDDSTWTLLLFHREKSGCAHCFQLAARRGALGWWLLFRRRGRS